MGGPIRETGVEEEIFNNAASRLYYLSEKYNAPDGMRYHIRQSWPEITRQLESQMNALGGRTIETIEPGTIFLQGENGLTEVNGIEVQGATTMPAVINLEDGSSDGLLKRLSQIRETNHTPATIDSPVVNLIYVNGGDLTTPQLQEMVGDVINDIYDGQNLPQMPGTMTIIGGDDGWKKLFNDPNQSRITEALWRLGIDSLDNTHVRYLSMVKLGMVAYQSWFDKAARDILQESGLEASDTNIGRIQARANYIRSTIASYKDLPD